MERLTKWAKNGCAYLAGVKDDEQEVVCESKNTLQCMLDAFKQLAAYEDTNHTPEECAAAFEELAAYRAAEQDDKWIGVKDRLPTEADANSNFQVLANHKASSKQCWHWMSVVENPFDFTSWMPIPAPSAKAALKEQEG